MTEPTQTPEENSTSGKPASRVPKKSLPRWTSEEILQGGREAIIVHQDAEYRLRMTRQGGLILYK